MAPKNPIVTAADAAASLEAHLAAEEAAAASRAAGAAHGAGAAHSAQQSAQVLEELRQLRQFIAERDAAASGGRAAAAPVATPAAAAPAAAENLNPLAKLLRGRLGKWAGEGVGGALGASSPTAMKNWGLAGQTAWHLGTGAPILGGLIGLGLPFAGNGIKNSAETGWNLAKKAWSSESDITHEADLKKQGKINTDILGSRHNYNRNSHEIMSDTSLEKEHPEIATAISKIPDDEYEKILKDIASGGSPNSILTRIEDHGQSSGSKSKMPKMLMLPGTVHSKGGVEFAIALRQGEDGKHAPHFIPISDDENDRGGVWHGSLNDFDEKNKKK